MKKATLISCGANRSHGCGSVRLDGRRRLWLKRQQLSLSALRRCIVGQRCGGEGSGGSAGVALSMAFLRRRLVRIWRLMREQHRSKTLDGTGGASVWRTLESSRHRHSLLASSLRIGGA